MESGHYALIAIIVVVTAVAIINRRVAKRDREMFYPTQYRGANYASVDANATRIVRGQRAALGTRIGRVTVYYCIYAIVACAVAYAAGTVFG